MTRQEIVQCLIDIHSKLFVHSIQNSRGRTQIPLFSIHAPGHTGVDNIEIPRLNLDLDTMPDDIKNEIQKVLRLGKSAEKFPMKRDGIRPGLIDCFLKGFQNTHIIAVASNPLHQYRSFLSQAEDHSKCIAAWLDNGTTSKSIVIIIQPEVSVGKHTTFGHWIFQPKTLPELCVEGYMGQQSGQEAAERVFSSSFFIRDMKTMPASADEILAEVDILVLTLWLSLGNIYRIQDIRFEKTPWKYSPDDDSPWNKISNSLGQCEREFSIADFCSTQSQS
jgi:hypothetical protein